MAKIILNNEEFQFVTYNRVLSFINETPILNGYINNISGENLITRLMIFSETPITSIIIKKDDGTIVYTLDNINAKITSVEESYNDINGVSTNLNLQFNQ